MAEVSTNINWYPGHMEKAKRQMIEQLKLVDIIVELRDARAPMASENPLLKELGSQKPRLIVLTKKDMADDAETEKWLSFLNETTRSIALCSMKDEVKKIVSDEIKDILKEKLEKAKARGIRKKVLRAMVVGIPNVGKSTFINAIVKKKVAKAENRPGVTRSLQWIRLHEDIELLDTPGVLWPKFSDQEAAHRLALIGTINDSVLDKEAIAVFGLSYLVKMYPKALEKRYDIQCKEDPYELLRDIALSKKWLKKEGEADTDKSIDMFLSDVRNNNFGKVSWEKCDVTSK